jgi:DNA-binding response OmpR family regulator
VTLRKSDKFAREHSRYDAGMKPRVLVVEDEPASSEPPAEHLTREGLDAEVTGTIEDATKAWRASPPDLMLLDVMLPDGDGSTSVA